MAEILALPAPYGGVNELTPVLAVKPPECINLLNFNTTAEGVTLRRGDKKFQVIATATGDNLLAIAGYGDTSSWALVNKPAANQTIIYNLGTGAADYTHPASTSSVALKLEFNKYLFLLRGSDQNFAYNGAAWGTLGYTGSSFYPFGGAVYNGRCYLVQQAEAAFWYSDVASISGPVTKVDMSTLVSRRANLTAITTFTLSENVTSVQVVAFVFSTGEILFYTGSYPDSTDWQQVGVATIPQPITYDCCLPYQGDSLVMVDTGVVSLRDLFLKGSQQALALSVNSKIAQTWQDLVQNMRIDQSAPVGPLFGVLTGTRLKGIRAVWDKKNERLIFGFPTPRSGIIGAGDNFYFVFDANRQAWAFHQRQANELSITDMIYFQNKILIGDWTPETVVVVEKEGSFNYSDYFKDGATGIEDYTGFNFEIELAPLPLGRSNTQQVTGVDVIMSSGATVDVTLAADLGVQTTASQSYPSTAGTMTKAHFNTGIEGTYVQATIDGSTLGGGTSTSGTIHPVEIYGLNIWTQQGTRPR